MGEDRSGGVGSLMSGLAVRLGMLRARLQAAVAAADAEALARVAEGMEDLLPELARTARPDAALRQAVRALADSIGAAEQALAPVLARAAAETGRDRRLRGAYR